MYRYRGRFDSTYVSDYRINDSIFWFFAVFFRIIFIFGRKSDEWMKRYLLLYLLLISSWVQASRVIFDRITTEDGLASSRVTSVLRDRSGYMWVGTAEGLSRYDGCSFKTYLPVTDDPGSIQGSYIGRLFEDTSGAIWIFFSSGGVSRYDPAEDTFRNFTKEWLRQQLRVYGNLSCFSAELPGHIFIGTDNGLLEYDEEAKTLTRFEQGGSAVASSPVNCMYMAPDSVFWIGTLSGFSAYDRQQGTFRDYTIQTNDRQDVNTGILNGVNAIYVDRYHYMWLGTGKKGAFRAADMGSWDLFQPVGQPDVRIYQFLETRSGDLWIGHNKGATLIDRTNRVSLRNRNFFDSPEDLAPTGECHVRSLTEDANGTVWFYDSRFNQGLFYYPETTRTMEALRNIPEDPYSISSNQISCFYLDRSGHIWIGHPNYGVSRGDLNPPLFRFLSGYTEKENLSSNHILAVFEDSESNLWVGTTKGLDRINARTSRIDRRYAFSPARSPITLSGKIIGSIQEGPGGHLWISYLDAPPDRLSLETLQVTPFSFGYRESYAYTVKFMAKLWADSTGLVWFTTRDGGLIKYDPDRKRPYFYTQPPLITGSTATSFPDLYSLCLDTDRWVWIGTDGEGLRSLDAGTETFTNYKHIPGEPNSLSSDHIHCLYADASGSLWIGTSAGLDRYDKRTGHFEHFTPQHGLSGNIVQGILEGEPGVLFISTNKGLSRLDVRSGKFINYSTANGLLSNEFIAGACCKRKSGELVFGTTAGIVSFYPSRLEAELRKTPESLSITNFSVEGTRGDESLRVGFVAFDYSHPRSVRYRYRLEGYDNDWKTAEAGQGVVLYSQLPSGRYTFRVATSSNGDTWSKEVSREIRILPPWWRTGWFFLLVVVAGGCLFTVLYKNRGRWLRSTSAVPVKEEENRGELAQVTKFGQAVQGVVPETAADPDQEFIAKATKVVWENMRNPQFDVELFASLMAMSRASLFRKLKSATGCPASTFIRNIRIKEAAGLLGQRTYTIGEVATQVGFSDPNYFTRCFKEVYGVTPSEFMSA